MARYSFVRLPTVGCAGQPRVTQASDRRPGGFRTSKVETRGSKALTTQGAKIRYFFDLHDGRETFIAQEPNHFEGAEEARRQARRYLLEAAMDVIPVAGEQHKLSVVVRDDKRAVLRLFLIFTEERHAPDWPLAD